VEHEVVAAVAAHRVAQLLLLQHVALDEPEVGLRLRLVEEARLAGGEVVVGGDGVSVGEQAVDQVAADEPGPAGDEVATHADDH
jgi:hypothetical protein